MRWLGDPFPSDKQDNQVSCCFQELFACKHQWHCESGDIDHECKAINFTPLLFNTRYHPLSWRIDTKQFYSLPSIFFGATSSLIKKWVTVS